jgi:signal recognition particle subunit SRP54
MVLDKLGDQLKATLRKITGATFVDEKLINELVKDIQRALLQADVNVQLVFSVTKGIKDRSLNDRPPKGLTMREHVVNIVYEELVKFLGGSQESPVPTAGSRAPRGEKSIIETDRKPLRIMLVGLFGNGKTTTCGKLAKYYKKRGHRVAMVSTDTWRPAAADQLEQLGKQVEVQVFTDKTQKDPTKIFRKFEKELDTFDVVIIDTAGRDALNDELVTELDAINSAVKADERLLVMNADVGQAAQKQAQTFHDIAKVTGVIITKLDGTAKGGGALTACAVTGAPVKFIGVGEKIDDFEEFRPQGFVGRLLGMGDLESLLEKANEAFDAEDAEAMGKRVLSGEFNLVDLYEQMQAMRKMGPLSKVMGMLPGMGQMQLPKEALEGQEQKLQQWKYIMDSMTKDELSHPEETLSPARIERIASGSGQDQTDVRALIKQYKQSKKMVKMFKGMQSEKDMQKLLAKAQRGGMGKKIKGRMKF